MTETKEAETLVAGYTCDSCADQRLGTITILYLLVCTYVCMYVDCNTSLPLEYD